ncbi:hypothetical protein [Cohnella panacarvi]|uniref:hypothetical protein n=1 Tax=Cohnella panacarvi TaxID=400776 RepID=UPI00047B038B|nr:hypothetical protein [Cohnella panacarvi]
MNVTRICIVFLFGIFLAVGTGCADNGERYGTSRSPQASQAEQIVYTSTVVSKSIKSDKFLVEISSPDIHEFIEVTAILWDRIKINDTVGFNASKEIVAINNVLIE